RSDIAKQLLTMIATLLTTVVGFYFGSRTGDGAPPSLEELGRRAAALNDITSVGQRTSGRVTELRKGLSDLESQLSSVASTERPAVQEQVDKLKSKLDQAESDLEAAGQVVAQPPANVVDIEKARTKAAAAEKALADVRAA